MLKFNKFTKPEITEINAVPYIDVLLVLLVIFFATAPVVLQGVNVELPESKATKVVRTKQIPIILSVNSKMDLFLNIDTDPNKSISSRKAQLVVAAAIARDRTRQVFIKADPKLVYGELYNVMSLLQSAGAKNIGLVSKAARS